MTKTADDICHRYIMEEDFKPGVYRHWKGGLYHALALGWANEVPEPVEGNASLLGKFGRERVVIYLSMTTGEFNTRPLNHNYKDAWNDMVHYDGSWLERFHFVGPQPIPT